MDEQKNDYHSDSINTLTINLQQIVYRLKLTSGCLVPDQTCDANSFKTESVPEQNKIIYQETHTTLLRLQRDIVMHYDKVIRNIMAPQKSNDG